MFRSRKRGLLPLSLALACLASVSCFEPPVRENLTLRFLANGYAVVTSRVLVGGANTAEGSAVRRRLAEVRASLLAGSDPWSQRFSALNAAAERSSWEKRLGDLSEASHSALVTEEGELAHFFGDTSLRVTYAVRPEAGVAELTIVPGPSTRATRKQQKDLEAALASWSADLAGYFADSGRLYGYLDAHPDRGSDLLGTLLKDVLPEGEKIGELSAEEKRLVEKVDERMSQVLTVLGTPEGEAYSLDEISHLVFDPFPAKLTVRLPAIPREVEGFERHGSDTLTVNGLGFWDALLALEGRWLAPDLLSTYVEHRADGAQKIDLAAFVAQPRRVAAAPDAAEVRAALVGQLAPAPVYRAVWTVHPDEDPPANLWDDPKSP
jgi:hypothetical protein